MTKIYDGYVMALMRVKVQVRNLELPEVPSVENMTAWLKKQEEFDMTEGFEPVTVETVDALEARPVRDVRPEYVKALVGKTITRVYSNQDKAIFRLSDGSLYGFYVEGDCCSSSWIESTNGDLKGEVLDVNQVDLPNVAEEEHGGELIQAYAIEVYTSLGGVYTIEFRNSSNGYYGGSAVWGDKTEKDVGGME